MERYIDAVSAAEIISEKLNIPLGDLVDVFAEIPTAEVVPRSEAAVADRVAGMTYAEKIRSLTDEQLAEVWMCPQVCDEETLGIPAGGWCCPRERNCNKCILSFLKQNVGEEPKEDVI